MKIIDETRVKILSGTYHHIGMIARVREVKSNGDCVIVLGPERTPSNISQIDTNPDNEQNSVKQGFIAIVVK
jgi:hypothetical protein